MTLGPEMFGLKRISDVNSTPASAVVKGNGSGTSNPIALNRRGFVITLHINIFFILCC